MSEHGLGMSPTSVGDRQIPSNRWSARHPTTLVLTDSAIKAQGLLEDGNRLVRADRHRRLHSISAPRIYSASNASRFPSEPYFSLRPTSCPPGQVIVWISPGAVLSGPASSQMTQSKSSELNNVVNCKLLLARRTPYI